MCVSIFGLYHIHTVTISGLHLYQPKHDGGKQLHPISANKKNSNNDEYSARRHRMNVNTWPDIHTSLLDTNTVKNNVRQRRRMDGWEERVNS